MIGIVTEGFYGYQPESTKLINTGGAPGPCPEPPTFKPLVPSVIAKEFCPPSIVTKGDLQPSLVIGAKLEPSIVIRSPVPQIIDAMFTPDIAESVVEGDGSVLLNCTTDVAVGDAVYLRASPPETVSPALAAPEVALQTEDAIGIVIERVGTTQCRVLPHGLTKDLFTGLLQGQRYFLSDTVPGGITTVRPTDLGAKVQEIGRAASATKFFAAVESSLHPEGGDSNAGVIVQTDNFIATALQTVFALTILPVDGDDVVMVVNGDTAYNGTDFTVSGKTLTWLDNTFTLSAGDVIRIDYEGLNDRHRTEIFTVTFDGQTDFVINEAPSDTDDITFVMNGAMYINGTDFSVSGLTVTWLNTDFSLVTGDKVRIDYGVLGDRVHTDSFVATTGQTVFETTLLPAHPEDLVLSVNGAVYTNAVDFTVVGNIVTWLDVDFVLAAGDQLRMDYEV